MNSVGVRELRQNLSRYLAEVRGAARGRPPGHGHFARPAIGLNRNSVVAALEGLRDRADVVATDGSPQLTDPVFELWLQRRGVLPSDFADRQ